MPRNTISSSTTTTAPPKNWPSTLPYLTKPVYSPTLTPTHLTSLRTKPPSSSSSSTINSTTFDTNPNSQPTTTSSILPNPLVRIYPITDPTHPAANQTGLFAAHDLKPHSFILEYTGVIHASPPPAAPPSSSPPPIPASRHPSSSSTTTTTTAQHDPHASSNYDLVLDRHADLAIDAAAMGNEARFINDYRGVAPRPNAEFREWWCAARGERAMGVWVLPPAGGKERGKGKGKKGGIRKGEEILVSYGRGFWGARRAEDEGHHEYADAG